VGHVWEHARVPVNGPGPMPASCPVRPRGRRDLLVLGVLLIVVAVGLGVLSVVLGIDRYQEDRDGVHGTFTAERVSCPSAGRCRYVGTFVSDDGSLNMAGVTYLDAEPKHSGTELIAPRAAVSSPGSSHAYRESSNWLVSTIIGLGAAVVCLLLGVWLIRARGRLVRNAEARRQATLTEQRDATESRLRIVLRANIAMGLFGTIAVLIVPLVITAAVQQYRAVSSGPEGTFTAEGVKCPDKGRYCHFYGTFTSDDGVVHVRDVRLGSEPRADKIDDPLPDPIRGARFGQDDERPAAYAPGSSAWVLTAVLGIGLFLLCATMVVYLWRDKRARLRRGGFTS
jgi:hypothetical protein